MFKNYPAHFVKMSYSTPEICQPLPDDLLNKMCLHDADKNEKKKS